MIKKERILELLDIALKVREGAYAPYSNFKVGALVIDNNDNIYHGVNVENGSYGLTNCAERSAIFAAVTGGMTKIKTIVVVADTTGPVSPCGACRQVISEFADSDTKIILGNVKRDYKIMTLDEILPYGFKL